MAASSHGSRPLQHNVDLNLFNLTPDLLDQKTILSILESRCIQTPNMKSMTKEQLLALFMRVVPLPQRRNLKGKNLSEQSEPSDEVLNSNNCISIGFNKTEKSDKLVGLHSVHKNVMPTSSRLKPPPDVINYNKKKITLNRPSSSKSNSSTGNQDLDKIIIKDRTKTQRKLDDISTITETKCLKTESVIPVAKNACETKLPNKISLNPSTCAEDKLPKQPPKRVKLKRPSCNVNTEVEKSESKSEAQSKRQKVIQP